jgi:hypothetical protein
MQDCFNLVDEKWIPVLRANGRADRVGLRQALAEAGSIRQVAASNPMDNVALLRFLLAVMYWCKDDPPTQAEKDQILAAERFPAEWFVKIDQQKECFNLLGDGKRFYQYGGSSEAQGSSLTANYLLHDVPSGTNAWHFRHSADRDDGLCPGCCAMGLVRLPLFSTSGGRGKPPGINAKPPVYVVPFGESLLETLLLNWARVDDLGTPAWENPGMRLPPSGRVPLLAGLTWLPRRVWLDDPSSPAGTCILCGRQEGALVRTCVFAGVASAKLGDDAPARDWRDPHVVYARDRDGKMLSAHAADAMGSPDAASNQWAKFLRDLLAEEGVPLSIRHAAAPTGSASSTIHLSVAGFSSVKNDKYLEAWETRLAIPVNLLPRDGNVPAGNRLEQWIEEVRKGWAKARPSDARSSGRKHMELLPALTAIRPHVESRVSANVTNLLSQPDSAWPQAVDEYRRMMPVIAGSLAPGFTTRAVQRRNQIAAALPDMTAKSAPKPRKPQTKKGGDQ